MSKPIVFHAYSLKKKKSPFKRLRYNIILQINPLDDKKPMLFMFFGENQ